MPKRFRNSLVEIKSVDDKGIVIQYGHKEYYINGGKQYIPAFTDPEFECTIVHNCENRAMLNVENIRYGGDIFRQEINPLKYKDSEEWVVDE